MALSLFAPDDAEGVSRPTLSIRRSDIWALGRRAGRHGDERMRCFGSLPATFDLAMDNAMSKGIRCI